jgi:enoyl-CoA hydratase
MHVIALFGIVNTLALSAFERVRELGLLRAVGMTRRQVRSTLRWESVLFAWITSFALADQGRRAPRGDRRVASGGMSAVLVSRNDDVTVVTINRPERRNAIDGPTAAQLAEAFEAFDADEGAHVAVLAGAEGTFCAGADLQALSAGDAAFRLEPEGRGPLGVSRMTLRKPVIAAVEGYAVAGGLELALWCDLRVAAHDAVFGVFCRRWGVPLMDGGTIRLPRLIGHSRAMDMILTGRGVSGDEALAFGLANRLVEPGQALEAAVALAGEIAAFPQRCVQGDRHSATHQWGLDLDSALRQEFADGMDVIASGETLAGAARFAGGAGRHGSFSD